MLSYAEGVIESIEEEGVLKKAKEDGSEEKRDAIFMEKIVYFRSVLGKITRFTITKDKFKNELEVGKYYYVFSEGENIKEIYNDKEDLEKNLKYGSLDGNQKGEKGSDKVGFLEGSFVLFILMCCCVLLSGLEASLFYVLLDYCRSLSPLVGEVSKTVFLSLVGGVSVLNLLTLCYWMSTSEKKELKQKNKLVDDFREKMNITSKDKDIISDVVLPEKVAVLNQ